jgi:hypothetical protein
VKAMLTAIRNIYSIVTNYDEHRLGCEESMAQDSVTVIENGTMKITFVDPKPEPKKLSLEAQYCDNCKMAGSLYLVDKERLCEFCRRSKAITRPEPHIVTRFRRWLAAMIEPGKISY